VTLSEPVRRAGSARFVLRHDQVGDHGRAALVGEQLLAPIRLLVRSDVGVAIVSGEASGRAAVDTKVFRP